MSANSGTLLGTRVPRREDPALLTGEGHYVADIALPGMLHAAVVRSPHAHARIKGIDVSSALGIPGVVAAFTGADLQDQWANPLPCAWPVTPDMKNPRHLPLAVGKVNFVGDGVAVVLATSEYAAHDGADAVLVDYEPLPAVLDLEDAASDREVIHEELGTNKSYLWELSPNPQELEKAFASASHIVARRYVQQRLIPSPMEPRGVLVLPEPYGGRFTVYSATQIPHILKVMLAMTLGIPETHIRVIAPDVGGGFGSKLEVYPEEALALALARKLGKPIRWIETRSENCQAAIHGRGQIQDIELAADSEGRVIGVKVSLLADMGAYLQLVSPGIPILGAFLYTGAYDVGAYSFSCTGVFTNKTPTDAYRGAGRPEATYAIERAMDALAHELGMDPAELRKRNFISPEKFPYSSVSGLVLDSGNYVTALEECLRSAGYEELRSEQALRRSKGDRNQIGIGISSYVEMCGLAPSRVLASLDYSAGGWEAATVRILPTGKVQAVTGTSPHGQGHETSWALIVADRLGVDPEDVEVLHGDTDVAPYGLDTYGSRSLPVGGSALYLASERVLDKARKIAAHKLEAAEEDLEFKSAAFSVRGSPDRSISLDQVAFEAFSAHDLPEGMEPNLEASCHYDPVNFTFPFGTHLAVVEVDTETGAVRVLRYIAVDDCGNQVNPLIVEGQVHGGIAQGVAQALWEEAVYDPEGNLVTSSLMDYLVPSAAELPDFETGFTVTPSPVNPMGVKGVGETGTIAATPAIMNALVDALIPYGIKDLDMPASPEKIWRALEQASQRR
jgi:carbon-monoxide dehydrogenase large subunit